MERDLTKEFDNLITMLVNKKIISVEDVRDICGWKETKEFDKIREYIFNVANMKQKSKEGKVDKQVV